MDEKEWQMNMASAKCISISDGSFLNLLRRHVLFGLQEMRPKECLRIPFEHSRGAPQDKRKLGMFQDMLFPVE